jgi:hypothetical protein
MRLAWMPGSERTSTVIRDDGVLTGIPSYRWCERQSADPESPQGPGLVVN